MSQHIRIGLISTLSFVLIWAISLWTHDDGAKAQPTSDQAAAAGPATAGQVADPLAEDPAKAEVTKPKKKKKTLGDWLGDFAPILILLVVVAVVIVRLPKLELGHDEKFRRRRVMNWLPLGLTYAFLYMGRYNLTVAKSDLKAMTFDLETGAFDFVALIPIEDFSIIFAAGTITYGISFLINGPLTDKIGGKAAILIGAAGSLIMNALMAAFVITGITDNLVVIYSVLYAMNMYFQSFGAVAIVKVNAPWFHVRERGVFGAIFGILISLGVYFAYDWGGLIVANFTAWAVFAVPAGILLVFWFLVLFMVKNSPGEAGLEDFDTADASSGDDGPQLGAIQVFKMMLTNRIILTIAAIEFCSGFLRQAIMQYYRIYAKATIPDDWVLKNWGLLLCCAGILGGMFAGVISDHLFQSRRGPVAAVLYGVMLVCTPIVLITLGHPVLGWMVVFMSMAVIGVHGMLSGTASMDFGGRKNVGVAVGIIDGMVYLGTGFMAGLYAVILPTEEAAKDPANWDVWPISMIPMAAIGLYLATKLWNAKPKGKTAAAH